MYSLSFILEKILKSKEVELAIFLDTEGAFEKVPIETVLWALKKRGIDVTIVKWIKVLLPFRYINAALSGNNCTAHENARCLQRECSFACSLVPSLLVLF